MPVEVSTKTSTRPAQQGRERIRYSLIVIDLSNWKCAGDIEKFFLKRKAFSVWYWPSNHIFRLWFSHHISLILLLRLLFSYPFLSFPSSSIIPFPLSSTSPGLFPCSPPVFSTGGNSGSRCSKPCGRQDVTSANANSARSRRHSSFIAGQIGWYSSRAHFAMSGRF